MPSSRVLSVGQCGYDHGQISRHITQSWGAEVIAARTHAEALEILRGRGPFRLVLVNRVGDSDGAKGVDLIRTLKADPELAEIPVMLVSNFAESQEEAIRAGALKGFGKADLGTDKELTALQSVFPDIQ